MKTSIIRKALVLLMVLVCQQVHAHDFEVNGIYYGISLFNKNTAYVTHKGKDYAQSYAYSGSINIPDKVTYNGKTYTVATIGGYAFWNCADLKSVTLPNTITDIHQHAFEGCHGLETIAIPASVNKIHDQAFFNCHKLNLIELKHTTPPTLGNGVFEGVNYNQARLKVPFSAYNTYKNNSTWNSFKLAHYDVNGIYYQPVSNSQVKVSYRNIYDENSGTFYNSYSGNVTIPSEVTIDGNKCTVTSIGEKAFSESGGLKSVVIPSSVHTIEEQAFYDCFSMTSVTIGNGVTTINSSAFHGCTGLTSVTIPNSVTNIGDYAFTGCSSIKTLSLGSKVSNISNYAFYGCKGLISVTSLNPTPPTCGSNVFKDVNVANIVLTVPAESISLYKAKTPWSNFKFEEQTEPEEPSVPEQPENPSEPELPEDTSGLSYNIINSTDVEVIAGAEKYSGDIVIPSQTTIDGKVYSVTGIGNYAFYYCSVLTSITIPNSVTSIGEAAFSGCRGLTSIIVESGNTVYDSRDNCNAIIETSTNTLITGCKNTVIPNSITSIGYGAFYYCSGLTSVIIPSSVTGIDNFAFSGCSGLTSIIVESGNTVYDSRDNCNAIIKTSTNTLITGCKNTVIPNSVTSIGSWAFSGCSSLTSITIPNSVTSIGYAAFYYCSGLTSVTIPNSVTGIGDSAFSGCSGLTSVTIPNSVTSIGDYAFSGCSGLTSVTIPNSVTSIGNSAFSDCSGLTSVISLNPTPPTCGTSVFESVNVGNITLEVPSESVSLYQSADTWKDFGTIKGVAGASALIYTILNETDVEVIASASEYSGDIVIPSQTTIDGKVYNVTRIGDYAFYNCSGLTSVTIPNSVTSISDYAFFNCSGLTSVTIPDGVTSIGASAFRDCSGLTSITIGNSVTSIGASAFRDCRGLTSVTIGNSVTSIVGEAFSGCTGLTSVIIPNSVTSIGTSAFYDCSGLTNITIPNSVTSIGIYAFYYCSKLTSITIPNSVTSIGNYAFSYCSGLTSVTSLSTTPPTCGTSVFNKVSVGNITLEVPAESVSLYQSADTWKDFGTIKGVAGASALIYTILNETDVEVIAGAEKYTGDIVIPSQTTIDGKVYNVTKVGNKAFYECTGLTSVTIPNSVTSIGSSAFSGCHGLTSITIPNSVTSIGGHAFNGCTGLASVTIPNSVTSIGGSAFWGCSGLTSVTIPNSVTSIGGSAFSYCNNLTSVNISDLEAWYKIDFSDYESNPLCYAKNLYLNGELLTNIEIPNSITEIKQYAFSRYSGLTSVTIPNSVISIGNYAFYECSGLTNVTIGNSVTSIGSWAFLGCSGLTSIVVESGNTVYDSRDNCNAIIETSTNILITGCKNTVIPNSVTSIGRAAFRACTGLSSITIPNSVTSIGSSAFSYCRDLASVTIPNSVTSIGSSAFSYCTGLSSITIPNSVTSIGDDAFFYCSCLTSVISLNPTPPTCGTDVFGNVSVGNITLEVPAESVSLYQSADTWKDFGTIKGIVEDEPELPTDNSGLSYNIISETEVEVIAGAEKYTGDIVIPNQTAIDGKVYNVTQIGTKSFYGCTGLTSITIPNSVTSIGENAFYGCSGLTSITIPESVTEIGGGAFESCSGLTSITIPNSVTSIGNNAFSCAGLTSIVVESGNTVYDSRDNCNAIIETSTNTLIVGCKNTVIPNSVTSIGKLAFQYRTRLTSITIPNSVTEIGSSAFYFTGLTSITIPNSVISIGNYAFFSCTGLTSVTSLNPTPPACGTDVFSNISQDAILYVPAESVDSYKSADVWKDFGTIKVIGESSALTYNILNETDVEVVAGTEKYTGDIVIPSQTTIDGKVYNVTKVGNWAFCECTGLTSVTIGNSVTSIGEAAFYNCDGLTSVTIPNSVTSIGYLAFNCCYGLTSITIPESVTSIGDYAFTQCIGLTSVTIPSSVISLGRAPFSGCDSINSFVVESGNTKYDSRENCNAIIETSTNSLIQGCENTVIPNSVTGIGEEAFAGCNRLTSITIPNSVTSIGNSAFSFCSLTSIIIPSSVTSIAGSIFYYCYGLTSIIVASGNTVYDSRNNCNAIIETSTNSLIQGCENTVIPNSVTGIGDNAFSGCSGLTSISIPSSVTSIGNYAFYCCSGLTSVTSLNPTPPTCGTAVFYNVSVGNITLEVPSESISLYQSADTWKDFGTIEAYSSASRSESSGIDDILADGNEVEYYNLHGVRIVNPTKGIYIKREGNKVIKVVL